MLLFVYFLIVIALPLALGSYVVYNGLPRTSRCPVCADETLRLQSVLHRLGTRLTGRELHSRWCLRCGWRGTTVDRHRLPARRPVGGTSAMAAAPAMDGATGTAAPDSRADATGEATHDRTDGRDRVDLRTLCVDGDTWNVKVECWSEGDRWLARLVFVASGGQVCADRRSIEGDSVLEVISQAFRLPEQTLAGRLRSLR